MRAAFWQQTKNLAVKFAYQDVCLDHFMSSLSASSGPSSWFSESFDEIEFTPIEVFTSVGRSFSTDGVWLKEKILQFGASWRTF